ncbi:MAG: response regulator [Clostridiaceae bacterium]|nr:response regulator [Clostridiaceae bacterium]
MNKEKMEAMLRKSRYQFLKEKKEEIDDVVKSLLYFIEKETREDYDVIYRFFHSLKGTAGTLNLINLSSIAEKMELLLVEKEDAYPLEDKVIALLVKGIGQILLLVEEGLEGHVVEEKGKKSEEEIFEISLREITTNVNYTGKILIVDDDISLLNFLEDLLRGHGYEVMISSNPEEAMTTLKIESMDLVILDIVMPGKSGFDIHDYVVEEKIDVSVIFLTGLQEKNVRYKALRDGVDYFFQKPIEPNELLSRIEGIMKKQNKKTLEIFTDELTEAYTRKFFAKRFEEEKHRHERQKKSLSIAFLDLDYFKKINDIYGHIFGDEILKGFVEIIKGNLRNYDEVFRYGGDEFLILFPETTGEEAYEIVARIRKSVQERKFTSIEEKKDVIISFSAGIAMMAEEDLSMTDLIKAADAALYVAKENGRNQTIYEHGKMKKRQKRILVVDDVTLIANLIKTRLAYLEYDIEHAKDGEEALRKIKTFQPDVVLLDIMLPKIIGTEVLKRIKEDPSLKKLKIIMMSAKNKEKDIVQSFQLGANDYITKPFSLEVLEEKIKKVL